MAKTQLPPQIQASRQTFVEAGGHTTQSFGFGRIIGQVYALLYLSPAPMCLDEIVQELGVSKASVSMTIRQLQAWSAVKRVWVKGDRKDYYEAEMDFRAVLRNGLLETFRKKLATAGQQIAVTETVLQEALAGNNGDHHAEVETIAQRIQKAKELHGRISGLLSSPLLDQVL
jgi:DNA-binding transcriptional regulator GbsR (MarR family)